MEDKLITRMRPRDKREQGTKGNAADIQAGFRTTAKHKHRLFSLSTAYYS